MGDSYTLLRQLNRIIFDSFILQSFLLQVHSLFQSDFSTEGDLALPLSISSILFFSLRSSSACLHLLPRLPVTSILPSIFPSITCFVKQFLRKTCPIQLTFLLFIVRMLFLSYLTLVTLLYFSHDRSD